MILKDEEDKRMDRRIAVSWLATAAALLVLAAAAFWGGAALRTVVAPTGATAFAAEGEQPTYPGPEAYAEKIFKRLRREKLF